MRKTSFLLFLSVAVLSSSCATIMQGTTQEMSISSSPTSALVTDNGMQIGKTPLVADLKRKGNHTIRIELEGYKPYEVVLSRKTSGWVWGNIIFGGIPGLIIDALTGSLYVLQPEQIQAELIKNGAKIAVSENQIFIGVTMKPDPAWQRVGELSKID